MASETGAGTGKTPASTMPASDAHAQLTDARGADRGRADIYRDDSGLRVELVARGFAPGTDKGTTRAKPNIWSNMDDFQSKLDDFRAAAAKLAETAAAGDPGESRQQFVATGGTCKACHDEYKSQDYLY